MAGNNRKTGVKLIGNVPWGSHFCQFYQTKEDLIDILVPYFKAGLHNNEFCMWVTAEPLGVEEAKAALRKEVTNLDDYIKKGQIEILDYSEWYTKAGKFNSDEVLQGWVEKEQMALEKGFDGLRLTGNTFWLERKDWKGFTEYEATVDTVIGKHRMLAVCSYCLAKCDVAELIDVVSNHQFALIRRDGRWQTIESAKRKRTEEALGKAERERTVILDSMSELIIYQDMKMRVMWANRAAGESVSLAPEQLVGHYCYEIWHKRNQPCVGCPVAKVRETGQPQASEMTTRDGRVWSVRGYPVRDVNGDITGIVESALNITERKQAEEEIRKSRAQLQAILDGSPDGIRQVDTDLKILWANQATLHRNPEALGQTCYKALGNRDKPCEGCPSLHAMKTGKIERGVIYQPASSGVSGECHWEGIGVPVKDAEGKIVGAIQIIRNITERKRAEDEIRFAYAELEQIFETAADAMRVIDKDYYVLRMNKRYETLSGISRDEAVGKKCYEVLTGNLCHTPDCSLTRILNGEEYTEQEGERVLSDGTRIPCIMSATPFRGPDGKLLGIVGNVKDITERKQMETERREMEQKAQITSRLATVGEMASGIAHEINNPLTSVLGFAELLMRRDLPEDIKNDLEIIHTGAKRVASIISRLLTFARQRKPERTYANINEIIETTIELRAYELKTGNIKVTTQLSPGLPQTMADTGQLQQVFLNIILNAETEMKTAHGGGNLTVKTERVDNTIRISFKDDGPGIAKENLEKVFNPFFTTREVGEGTGLGLSICHGIVTEHKGRTYVKSRLGKGATFIIELPVVAEAKRLELVEPTGESETVSGAKILVVDDESAVLQFLDQLLTDEGYEVETAETASNALKRIKSKDYGVILLDIRLPDMNGTELYRRIQKIAPSLANRVVFITGDVVGKNTTEFLAKTKAPYITKPIDTEKLMDRIKSILP